MKFAKLPAFLQGPAAPYFDSFSDEEKCSSRLLTESLNFCFSPAVNREQFYQQFEEQTFLPVKDPALFLWCLRDNLERAEPHLSTTTTDALLCRQFMKGLPQSVSLGKNKVLGVIWDNKRDILEFNLVKHYVTYLAREHPLRRV